jgi:hypothetical protein
VAPASKADNNDTQDVCTTSTPPRKPPGGSFFSGLTNRKPSRAGQSDPSPSSSTPVPSPPPPSRSPFSRGAAAQSPGRADAADVAASAGPPPPLPPPSRFNFGADIFGELDRVPAALARGVAEAEAARVASPAAPPLPKATHIRVPQPVKTYAELAASQADDYAAAARAFMQKTEEEEEEEEEEEPAATAARAVSGALATGAPTQNWFTEVDKVLNAQADGDEELERLYELAQQQSRNEKGSERPWEDVGGETKGRPFLDKRAREEQSRRLSERIERIQQELHQQRDQEARAKESAAAMAAIDGEAAAKAMLVWMEREAYTAAKQRLHDEEAAHRAQLVRATAVTSACWYQSRCGCSWCPS